MIEAYKDTFKTGEHNVEFDNMKDYVAAVEALYKIRQINDVVEVNNNRRIFLDALNGALAIVRETQEILELELEARKV